MIVDHYEYLGIPVALKYRSGAGKWRFTARLGLTANYLVRASSTTVLYYNNRKPERSRQTKPSDYNKFNITPAMSAGVEYQLNSKMYLSAMPSIRYGLVDILDASITEKLYAVGLELGWNVSI